MINLDECRARISTLIGEITATTRALETNGVDPGHVIDKREALVIVKRIIDKAHGGV